MALSMNKTISQRAKPADYIEDLTQEEVDHLTNYLRKPSYIHEIAWQQAQICASAILPIRLLRSTSTLARLAAHIPFTTVQATLCPIHKYLHAPLLHNLIFQVKAEIGTKIRRLTTPEIKARLDPNVLTTLRRLESIHSLWLDPQTYEKTFDVLPSEPRYKSIEIGCEACALAYIGGDVDILRDLKATLLSRTSRTEEKRKPRLARFVDAWIAWSGDEGAILQESVRLARGLRHARKRELRGRRAIVDGDSPGQCLRICDGDATMPLLQGLGNGVHQDGEDDLEGAIIEYYANRVSTIDADINLGLGIEGLTTHDDSIEFSTGKQKQSDNQDSTTSTAFSRSTDMMADLGTYAESLYSHSSYSLEYKAFTMVNAPGHVETGSDVGSVEQAKYYEELLEVDVGNREV